MKTVPTHEEKKGVAVMGECRQIAKAKCTVKKEKNS